MSALDSPGWWRRASCAATNPVTVCEAGKQVAGLAQSLRDDEGFTYDTGAHFITNRLAQEIGVAAQCRTVCYRWRCPGPVVSHRRG